MTLEQWTALAWAWKTGVTIFLVASTIGGLLWGVYKTSQEGAKKGAASAGAAAAAVGEQILNENTAQTHVLEALRASMTDLGTRFTASDMNHANQVAETNRRLGAHDETLKTHADSIHTHDLRIRTVEDGLARVQTVVATRKVDRDLGTALVAALTPEPPKENQ